MEGEGPVHALNKVNLEDVEETKEKDRRATHSKEQKKKIRRTPSGKEERRKEASQKCHRRRKGPEKERDTQGY